MGRRQTQCGVAQFEERVSPTGEGAEEIPAELFEHGGAHLGDLFVGAVHFPVSAHAGQYAY